MNLAPLSGSGVCAHDGAMTTSVGLEVADVGDVAKSPRKPMRSETRPRLVLPPAELPSSPASFEDRAERAQLHEAERRAMRRRVSLARSIAPDLGSIAAAAAGVHAELRRVFGAEIPARV
jgi:hypothetical protein